MPIGGYRLEPNALRTATETERNVLVVAGPGAGKTELLAQRADFLLRTGSCRFPRRILAISFKTDAAENLRSRVAERCGPELASRLDSYTFHALAKRLIDHYRVVLIGDDALDRDYDIGTSRVLHRQITFDDMVPLAIDVLEASGVARNAVRNTYSHVFLDEFQDCTGLQYRLVRTAFGSTEAMLTAVGDTKQTIMRFAGALDGIFGHYARDMEAEVRYLYQNFRSEPKIRRLQNAMVKVMDPAAAVPDVELVGNGGSVDVLHFASCVSESNELADRIEQWISSEQVAPSEIAVLVRQQVHVYAEGLMQALDDRGIPYRNEQTLQDDFAQPAGQLILDFLAVTVHERQPEAYRRLMDVLTPSTGDDEVDARNAARWRSFLDASRTRLRAVNRSDDLADTALEVIRSFLEAVGNEQLSALSPEYGSGDRLNQVIDTVLGALKDLLRDLSGSIDDLAHITDDGAVRILTIHKAKGLEYHSVVVLGVEQQTYWGDLNDARATFFVAISRAKSRVILTTAGHRAKPPGAGRWDTDRTPHSEFLSYAEGLDDT